MRATVELPSLPIVLRPEPPWSEDEFFTFCQQELLDVERSAQGAITVRWLAGAQSALAGASLCGQLGAWNEQQRAGVALSHCGFLLADTSMLSAPVSWVSHAKWDAMTKADRERFACFCPDFVIELTTPSRSVTSQRQKMPLWISNGAQLAWLIDPEAKTVEIYRPDREPELLENPAEVPGEGPVTGFVLSMREVWSRRVLPKAEVTRKAGPPPAAKDDSVEGEAGAGL